MSNSLFELMKFDISYDPAACRRYTRGLDHPKAGEEQKEFVIRAEFLTTREGTKRFMELWNRVAKEESERATAEKQTVSLPGLPSLPELPKLPPTWVDRDFDELDD